MPRHAIVNPQELAQEFLEERAAEKPLVYWRSQWWEWAATHYREISSESVDAEIYRWMVQRFQHLPGNPPISTSRHRDVVHLVRAFVSVSVEVDPPFSTLTFEHRPATVTFQNGVLDMESLLQGKADSLRPHSPWWFSTVALPFSYDPRASCPKWDKFLAEVFEGDEERIQFWTEWMGYCCVQMYQFQHAVILVGEGQNGKGVCLRVLERLLGEQNVSHVPLDLFGERFQLLPTVGKLANIAGEISGSSKVAEEYLKMYTGGDPIYTDVKNKQGINLRATARLIFACNEIPQFVDRSSGLRRRLIIVPFNWIVPPDRIDRRLEAQLAEELPGIFNRAIVGLRNLLERGEFRIPSVSRDTTNRHLLESNTARLFLTENTYYQEGMDTATATLYEDYTAWCKENRLTPVLNNIQFGQEVRRHYNGNVVRAQRRVGNIRQPVYRNIVKGSPAEGGTAS